MAGNKKSSREYALKLMHDFNNEILSCNDSLDYIEIVIGVMIFSKLASAHFIEISNGRNKERITEESMKMMETVATEIANDAIKTASLLIKPSYVDKNKQTKLN